MKILVIFLCFLGALHGSNILGIFYHGGKSHHTLGEVLLKALAKKGHNVTMVSPFPLPKPFPNYTDINLTGILEDQKAREHIFKENSEGMMKTIENTMELTRAQVAITLGHPEMKKLTESGTKFDLIILDLLMDAPFMIYAKIFDAPVIYLCSHGTSIMVTSITGNPKPPSYVPSKLLPFGDKMTFFQRAVAGAVSLLYRLIIPVSLGKQQELLEKYYPDAPKIQDLMEEYFALVLSNAHYSFETVRPSVPNLIQIGGFHVQKPQKLPKEIQDFMDSAETGVVYFSLGSQIKPATLPQKTQEEILQVFAKLPYRVLWKWEKGALGEIPGNVMIRDWFPQSDILAHPNLKLFITHMGLLSSIEALHYGVPLLGIPICADQNTNSKIAVLSGYAVEIELENLSGETFSQAMNEVLENPKYAENARKRSLLLRDQPLSPMETAIFWVEHVIRHKGGKHLRNQGFYLPWYQYWMVDVVLVLSAVLTISIFVVYKILRVILRCFFDVKKAPEKKLKKQ